MAKITQALTRASAEYDQRTFQGFISLILKDIGAPPPTFRLSRRMTSRGGSTALRKEKNKSGVATPVFEITIASDLLYQQFKTDNTNVIVNGLECTDRLFALQTILEHEITHLLELSLWNTSNCKGQRFQQMSHETFGHTEYTHRMSTRRALAARDHNIRPGSRVSFRHKGTHREGIVARITKGATVMVQSKKGSLYTDGNRYEKFYVPIAELSLVKTK